MVLIVDEKCQFCEKFKDTPDLVVAKIRRIGAKGLKLEIGGVLIEPPVEIIGLPTLIAGDKIFIGRGPIEDYLGVLGKNNA